jgi:hypothetical protein
LYFVTKKVVGVFVLRFRAPLHLLQLAVLGRVLTQKRNSYNLFQFWGIQQ